MNNSLDTDLVMLSKNTDTNSVTLILQNTNCIVCGKPFPVARMGKLYCSSRCKQFGVNHKEKINQALAARKKGINPRPMTFFIDDFTKYDKTRNNIKRYKELERKNSVWNSIDQEIKIKNNIGLPIRDHLWNSYSRDRLTEGEEVEYSTLSREVDEEMLDLKLRELSLEQWSFLKSLYPDHDEIGFYKFVSSISREFIDQLSLYEMESVKNKEYFVIKNKYVNHCNLIAEGIIQFKGVDGIIA